jgi:hypothetical protein
MRNFGGIMLVLGIAGFLYCHNQLSTLDPVPEGLSISKSLQYPAGRMEMGKYAAAAAGFLGALLVMFPQGR